jgi:Sec-independent protein translocase protein TatA
MNWNAGSPLNWLVWLVVLVLILIVFFRVLLPLLETAAH